MTQDQPSPDRERRFSDDAVSTVAQAVLQQSENINLLVVTVQRLATGLDQVLQVAETKASRRGVTNAIAASFLVGAVAFATLAFVDTLRYGELREQTTEIKALAVDLAEVADSNQATGRLIAECVTPIAEDEANTTPAGRRCFERFAAGRVNDRRLVLCRTWAIAYSVMTGLGATPPPPIDPADIGGTPCPVPT